MIRVLAFIYTTSLLAGIHRL